MLQPDDPHPCQISKDEDEDEDKDEDKDKYDHDWKYIDDSFSHEFGTEQIFYRECRVCGVTEDVGPYDHHDDCED